MADVPYKRLTRDRMPRQFAVVSVGRVSLWLGSDHLLLVERSGFTESYKRFYFRDIQAITIQKTSRRSIWNGVLAIPFVICLFGFFVSMTSPRNTTGMVISSILLVITLLPIILNNIRGTACTCQLKTAVQIENLGSIGRVNQAHKVLDKIRPFIVAAQGQLTAEEVSARMQHTVLAQQNALQPAPSAASLEPITTSPPVPPILS